MFEPQKLLTEYIGQSPGKCAYKYARPFIVWRVGSGFQKEGLASMASKPRIYTMTSIGVLVVFVKRSKALYFCGIL